MWVLGGFFGRGDFGNSAGKLGFLGQNVPKNGRKLTLHLHGRAMAPCSCSRIWAPPN